MPYPAGTGAGSVTVINAGAVTTATIASGAVTATRIADNALYQKFTVARSGAGYFVLSGVMIGDTITSVLDLSGPSSGGINTVTSGFVQMIASNNAVQQLSTRDYTQTGLMFTIVSKGGGM